LILLLGIVLAVATFLGILVLMRGGEKTETTKTVPMVKVVVASANIPARGKIPSESLTLKDMQMDLMPPLAVTDVFSATGRIALTDIYAGQVILSSMISGKDASLIPAMAVPQGMVALAVPVNEIAAVAEALREGDRVDVIVSLNVLEWDAQGNESKPEYSAQFTVQNVEVLHVGSWAEVLPATETQASSGGMLGGGGGSAANVKLVNAVVVSVEPQDALVLKYAIDKAEAEGRDALIFVLRAVDSDEKYVTEPVNQDYMVKRFKFSKPPFIIRK
jgi:Flp pilus assembly protein CpaB